MSYPFHQQNSEISMIITLGSLFDGIEGFPLAASYHHIQTLWASEIEDFPIKVSSHHFPNVWHLGDIAKLDGGKLAPAHIVSGERSGLFMEQIRIIKEMRDADKNEVKQLALLRPRYMLWENASRELSPPHREKTFIQSSKRPADLATTDYHLLDLRPGDGSLLGPLWERNSLSLGRY